MFSSVNVYMCIYPFNLHPDQDIFNTSEGLLFSSKEITILKPTIILISKCLLLL